MDGIYILFIMTTTGWSLTTFPTTSYRLVASSAYAGNNGYLAFDGENFSLAKGGSMSTPPTSCAAMTAPAVNSVGSSSGISLYRLLMVGSIPSIAQSDVVYQNGVFKLNKLTSPAIPASSPSAVNSAWARQIMGIDSASFVGASASDPTKINDAWPILVNTLGQGMSTAQNLMFAVQPMNQQTSNTTTPPSYVQSSIYLVLDGQGGLQWAQSAGSGFWLAYFTAANSTCSSNTDCANCSACLNGTCQGGCNCPAHSMWLGETKGCICGGGTSLVNGVCKCGQLAEWSGDVTYGSCQCKPTSVWDSSTNTCVCQGPDGSTQYNASTDTCTCINGTAPSANGCACVGSATWDSVSKSCKCADPRQVYSSGVGCTCAGGAQQVSPSGQCMCLPGTIWNGTSCICSASTASTQVASTLQLRDEPITLSTSSPPPNMSSTCSCPEGCVKNAQGDCTCQTSVKNVNWWYVGGSVALFALVGAGLAYVYERNKKKKKTVNK